MGNCCHRISYSQFILSPYRCRFQWSISPHSCVRTTNIAKLSRLHWRLLVWSYRFLPKASFGLRVLSSPASVGLCVHVCVYQSRDCPHENSSLIQARITKFGPEMQNTLVWIPIVFGDDRPWTSRSNLTCKSNLTPFWVCPHHNSSVLHARITKFGLKMHLSTVKFPTNFGLDWFWSSLSFAILKPVFLPNLFAFFLAATKQLYEWYFLSVCLSVCPSVTPFWLCSHHRIIMKFSGVITLDQGKVHAKGQGQRSKVKVTEVTTQIFVSGL